MKFITRHTDYGLLALRSIAESETVLSVTDLCKSLRMPRAFLRSILQKLNKSGMLVSIKGKGGGFRLAKPAGEISLFDVMSVFQKPLTLNHCIFKKTPCPRQKKCKLRCRLRDIGDIVFKELKKISLESLVED